MTKDKDIEAAWDAYYKYFEERKPKAEHIQVKNVPVRLVLENVEDIEFSAKQVKDLNLEKIEDSEHWPLFRMQLIFSEKHPYKAAKRLKDFPDIVWIELDGKIYHLIWNGIHDDEINTLQKISKRAGQDLFEITVK